MCSNGISLWFFLFFSLQVLGSKGCKDGEFGGDFRGEKDSRVEARAWACYLVVWMSSLREETDGEGKRNGRRNLKMTQVSLFYSLGPN